jgi:hypothetical protein
MRASKTSDTALVLALLGGLLILGEAVLDGFDRVTVIGAFGIIAGLAIMAMAVTIQTRQRDQRTLGAGILLLSFLSLFGVSGFFFGALLGVISGILAITSYGAPFSGSPVSVYSARASGSPFSIGAACSRCGKPVPTWSGTCPYCGLPKR